MTNALTFWFLVVLAFLAAGLGALAARLGVALWRWLA